jgi:prevent-host-death family protein
MKVIPLSKAKANLSRYARLCREETVIVTVKGLPAFELVPLDAEDDLINQLLEHNPNFRKMLESRLSERSLSAKEAARRLR